MRLDSHHFFSERYTLEHLATILARNRFEGSLLIADTLEIAPPDFVKGIVLRCRSIDADTLDTAMRHPLFRGVCTETAQGLEELERRGLTLDFAGDLRLVPGIAAAHPELRIAIDHLGGPPFDGWDEALEKAAQIPRLCCKLSGLMRLAPSPRPYVRHALSLFGPHRLMFGSAWPESLPEYSWKENLAAFTQAIGAQPIELREELLGAVAGRFYVL